MVQTSISTNTKILLVSAAVLATGLGAYALGYYEYDWRLWDGTSPQQEVSPPPASPAPTEQASPAALVLTSNPQLPDAIVGRVYETQLTSSGGGAVRWVLEQGALPPGMKLDEENGIIYGTPMTPGSSLFRLKFSDGTRAGLSQFTLNVVAEVSSTPSPSPSPDQQAQARIATERLPNGRVGQPYKVTMQSSGSNPEVMHEWTLINGSIPGLTLGEDGILRGTPTEAGSYPIRVNLLTGDTSRPGELYDIHREYTVVIEGAAAPVVPAPAPPTPPTPPPAPTPVPVSPAPQTPSIVGGYPDGIIGGYYSSSPLSLSGGTLPVQWKIVEGNVPTGLYFSPNSQIAGYANQYGIFTFTVEARDQSGRTARADRTIHIRPSQPPVSASVDPDLSNRLRRIDLIGVQVHDLIKLQDDGNPDTQYDTTVYYIGADGRRHAFPNPHAYFTWFSDYSRVRIVAARELADIPLGANITYRPGVKMVKFLTDPRVYAVDTDRRLRWVKTEAVASALYGPLWMRQVDDISDAFYMDYRIGQEIDRVADYNPGGARSSAVYPSDVLPR